MNRYALTFPVRPESEAAVAEILSGYAGPPPGRPQAARPLLDRTSVFMAGPVVVRVVDITCPPQEAIRHLAAQPQIRSVEERLRPHLVQDRDLSDDDSRRRFLAGSVMRVVASRNDQPGHPPRAAAFYRALPGQAAEVVRLLAAESRDSGCGTTIFRRRDMIVHLVESFGDEPAVPLAQTLAPLVHTARPMSLVTDRVVGAVVA
ncbi:SchA/CurD like domain-containing protein [Lentzea fradiae]|uniref:SchA/CurD like domain-containing protein n=1 Tax=Lentzea fradiae TaxID=200378 RepID=A0A1G7LCK1_9PSEU|nr:SchA/CurD-like domain-containing protein [Lentzea fradiae]SDF47193.1 SchA/CurD like domain-containing protein [Lentzea fradiae]